MINISGGRTVLGKSDIVAFVPTKDGTKARTFYEDVLGLRFVSEDGFALVFDAHGTMVRVVKMQQFTPVQYSILGWHVKEIEKVVTRLQEQGVRFERFGFKQDELGIWIAPSGDKGAWFKDPDGNTLSVSEHVAWNK